MKTLLFVLLCFISVTATISGLLMITNPEGEILGLSLSLLDGTLFSNFFIPGLLLAIIVGGINLIASLFYLRSHPNRYNWAMAGGVIICGWIISQIIIIKTISWLHFIFLGIGFIIVLVAYQLKGKWAV
jgi:hypothetical protein